MPLDAITESDTASMTDDEIAEFLTQEGVGTLALAGERLPYLVPMSFGYDGESALYFLFLLFGAESRKETLADKTQRGRFIVYRAESIHEWRSVSLTGRITAVDDEWETLRSAMQNSWHPNLFSSASPMRGVHGYRFEITEWTGLKQRNSTP